MNAANMPRVPTILTSERNAKSPAWMNDPTNYHDRGDIDFNSCNEVCYEQGDFFGLDDLFTEKPIVWRGLAQLYGDWIAKYKLDGFRVDTARHVNAAFFRLWAPRIRTAARRAGIADFPIFGESASTTTTTTGRRTGPRRRRRRFSATTTWGARRCKSSSRVRHRISSCNGCCSGTTCSISFAARPSSTTETKSG
jgi:hypothetical protein